MRNVQFVLSTVLAEQAAGQTFGGNYRYSVNVSPAVPDQVVPDTQATFNNLPPGDWVVTVTGLDSTGAPMKAADGSDIPPDTAPFTVPDDNQWHQPSTITVNVGAPGG